MLIAHAERAGVWFVDGGIRRLADALTAVLRELGVELRFGATATSIRTRGGVVTAVEVDSGEALPADAVVFNGDAAALGAGLLGDAVRGAHADRSAEGRSLSAITWCMNATVSGFPLDHHNVFFGSDYADEFDSIFDRREIGREPTVYVCAQDRGAGGGPIAGRAERLLLLINAPPVAMDEKSVQDAERRAFRLLAGQGLKIDADAERVIRTTPNDFAALFPASDGALYGWPTHGWSGSFRRAGSGTGVAGLFLAGGTVHPGPGVPMVALSGRIAADAARRYVRQRSG
jgi:1-hydroxycarotenoid 3,4-desaturase